MELLPVRSALAGAPGLAAGVRRPAPAAPRLAPAAVEVLESLVQHRLLSTSQIRELHAPERSRRWCQMLLADLHAMGLSESVRAPGGEQLHFATARGTEAIETIPSREEPRRKIIRPEQAAGPLQQHTLAVNDVGLAFVHAARVAGDECPPLAWRHEIAHPITSSRAGRASELLIADALLHYLAVDDAGITFLDRFIELDRATTTVSALVDKLRRYGRLATYRNPKLRPDGQPVWRERYAQLPELIVAFANGPRHRLQRRMEALDAVLRSDLLELPAGPGVRLCLLEDLMAQGPDAPVFLAPRAADGRVGWRTGPPAVEAAT